MDKIKELNRMIKQYAADNNIPYVDYYSVFVTQDGGFDEKYSPDGVHPNLEGYKLMERIISKALVNAKLRQSVDY